MPDTKISALSAGTALAGTEEIPGVQSATTVKFTPAQIRTYVAANMTPITLTGGTVTSSTPVMDAAQTWNSGGVTFTGMKLNVTDTASASASLLADLQVGGTSFFNVRKDGFVTLGSSSGFNPPNLNLRYGSGEGAIIQANGTAMMAISLSKISVGANHLAFASAVTNGPDVSLVRSSAGVLKVANNGSGTGALLLAPVAVASLPSASAAGAGARHTVNDSSVTTFGSTVSGGGSTVVPVYSDGTNWKVG